MTLSSALQALSLPRDFVFLLRRNMHGELGTYTGLGNFIFNSPELNAVFATVFHNLERDSRLEIAFKSFGWSGIRERLFIYYWKQEQIEIEDNHEVLILRAYHELEEKLERYTVDGYSRHILLYFYAILLPDSQVRNALLKFLLHEQTSRYLQFFRQKTLEIDFLLLTLFMFEQFLGAQKLYENLGDGNYNSLYLKLSSAQKEDYLSVLLNYSYSIEDDLFLEDRI